MASNVVSGRRPTDPVVCEFIATETFEAPELGGTVYIKDQKYRLRKHPKAEGLRRMLLTWAKEGKVQLLGAVPSETFASEK